MGNSVCSNIGISKLLVNLNWNFILRDLRGTLSCLFLNVVHVAHSRCITSLNIIEQTGLIKTGFISLP